MRIPKEVLVMLASLLLEVWKYFKSRKKSADAEKEGNCDDKKDRS